MRAARSATSKIARFALTRGLFCFFGLTCIVSLESELAPHDLLNAAGLDQIAPHAAVSNREIFLMELTSKTARAWFMRHRGTRVCQGDHII